MTPDIHELVGAHAADALDDTERTAFEAHLSSCADCRAELTECREVLAAVAGAHEVLPPMSLEDAVVAAVASAPATAGPVGAGRVGSGPAPASADRIGAWQRAEGRSATGDPGTSPGDGSPTAGSTGTVHQLTSRRRASTWLGIAAAAAALFAGGVVVGRQGAPVAPAVAAGDMDSILAVALATDASYLPVDLMGTSTRVVVSDEMGKVAVLASDLPTPAKGMCYQVWRVAEDGTKESAGTFTPDADGHVAVVLEGGTDATAYVITMEPPGGSKEPTGEMVGQVDA